MKTIALIGVILALMEAIFVVIQWGRGVQASHSIELLGWICATFWVMNTYIASRRY